MAAMGQILISVGTKNFQVRNYSKFTKTFSTLEKSSPNDSDRNPDHPQNVMDGKSLRKISVYRFDLITC